MEAAPSRSSTAQGTNERVEIDSSWPKNASNPIQKFKNRLRLSTIDNKNQMNEVLRKEYQFQIPSLKGSDFLKLQGPRLSILHCANLEIVSTLESTIARLRQIVFTLRYRWRRQWRSYKERDSTPSTSRLSLKFGINFLGLNQCWVDYLFLKTKLSNLFSKKK